MNRKNHNDFELLNDNFGDDANFCYRLWYNSDLLNFVETNHAYTDDEANRDLQGFNDCCVAIKMNLPKIEGKSEKQVNYADDVRTAALYKQIERAIKAVKKTAGVEPCEYSRPDLAAEKIKAAYKELGENINTYTDAVLFELTDDEYFPSFWNELTKMTSAREILDNYFFYL